MSVELATAARWAQLQSRLAEWAPADSNVQNSASTGADPAGEPTFPATPGGWDFGMPAAWLAELLTDWGRFDPAPVQQRIDGLEHRFVTVAGQPLHVCLAAGRGSRPRPLLLTNGWPSSFLEYLELIPLLVGAGNAGPDGYDCFSLVIPALPGYGHSAPPVHGPMTGREVARLWNRLMTDVLGHHSYVAHGTDLGAGVTAWLARDHAASVAAIHLGSPHLAPAREPRDDRQRAFAEALAAWTKTEGGYAHMHASKPATLGAALLDSPAGLAAWIGEKFMAWSSTEPAADAGFMRELLLATLTFYWSTATIATSMLPYWAHAHVNAVLPIDDASAVATSVDIFGGERVPFPPPPRSLGERYFNVVDWVVHSSGGHFPAASVPQLLADRLRTVFGVAAAGR